METVTPEQICMGMVLFLLGMLLIAGGPKLLGAAMIAGEDALYNHDRGAALEIVRQNPAAYCHPSTAGDFYLARYGGRDWSFTADQVYSDWRPS